MVGSALALAPQICGETRRVQSDPPAPDGSSAILALYGMTQLPGRISALPPIPIPRDNPQTQAKIELGRMLFFDVRLSRDYSLSCASCHDPEKAYSDGRSRAVGIGHKVLQRRSPSLLNSGYNSVQFWDGRMKSLEEQAQAPIMAKGEMNMADEKTVVARLRAAPEYKSRFQDVFGDEVSLKNAAKAISAFERTLVTPDSPFDNYARGDKQALSGEQKRGLVVFFGKASCTQCHNGANFTDNKFHPLGGNNDGDDGRFVVSKDPADQGAFKTPSLRNVALRPPYMHNGSISTLKEVIDLYDRGGGDGPKSSLLHRLDLTPSEKDDLLSFLSALNGRLPLIAKPNVPPLD
jgi:cytochrome c peroxidase